MEIGALTPAQLERRRRLWQQALTEIEPDERERIQEHPQGDEALALAVTVELLATDKLESLTWNKEP